jgi:hypothetical protein
MHGTKNINVLSYFQSEAEHAGYSVTIVSLDYAV